MVGDSGGKERMPPIFWPSAGGGSPASDPLSHCFKCPCLMAHAFSLPSQPHADAPTVKKKRKRRKKRKPLAHCETNVALLRSVVR